MSDPLRPYGSVVPLQGDDPSYLARNLRQGLVQTYAAIPGMAGWAGVPGASELAYNLVEAGNKYNDTFTAEWGRNPITASLQALGGALAPGPKVGAMGALGTTGRVVEALLPLTSPYTLPRVAANAVGAHVLGPAVEGADRLLRAGHPSASMPITDWTTIDNAGGEEEAVPQTGAVARPFVEATAPPVQEEVPPVQEAPVPVQAPAKGNWFSLISSANAATPPQDTRPLDKVARTILAEAGGQGIEGMAAVAHVINTRAQLSGKTPEEIVLAPGQFEPWMTPAGRARMAAYTPGSAAYERAYAIAQGAIDGSIPDPTGGATHFYAPLMQASLGRNVPRWAEGEGQRIGGHVFYARPQDFGGGKFASGGGSRSVKPLPSTALAVAGPEWIGISNSDSAVSPTTPTAPPERSWGEVVADWLPAIGLVGAGGVGVRGMQQYMQRRAASAATANTVVNPGSQRNPGDYVPNPIRSAANEGFDEGTVLRSKIAEAEKGGFITPEKADYYYAQVDMGTNQTVRSGQASEVTRTGVLPDGRKLFRSWADVSNELSRLERADPVKAAARQEVWSIQNELANRVRAMEMGKATKLAIDPATGQPYAVRARVINPQTGDWIDQNTVAYANGRHSVVPQMVPEPARVGMTDKSWDDLHTRLATLMQDPENKAFIKEMQDRADVWRRYLVDNGRLDVGEAVRLAKRNPFYMPTIDAEEVRGRHLVRRQIEENTAPHRAQDIRLAMLDYEREITEAVLHNNAKRDLANFLHDYQQSLPPGSKRMVGDISPVRQGDKHAPDSVSFYVKGKQMKIDVYTPELAAVMRNDPKAAFEFMNGLRQRFQFWTTGPGALVPGNPFFFISAHYNYRSAQIVRGAGTSFGIFDRKLQDAGFKGLRGDPTARLQQFYAIGADMASMVAREAGAAFKHDPKLANIADTLTKIYETSMLHEMNKLGAANSGGTYGGDYATRLRADIGSISPSSDAVRPINAGSPRNFTELRDTYAQYGYTAVPHEARKLWQLIKESMDIIANSANSAYYRQNVDSAVSRAKAAGLSADAGKMGLARKTRQLGADASISGANRTVQRLTSTIPYGNILLQGIGTYMRAFRENPIGTTTAVLMSTLPIAIYQAISAMVTDEQAIAQGGSPRATEDMVMGNTGETAGTTKIYMPGLPPERAIRLPIEPGQGPLQTAMNMFVRHMLGMDDPKFYSPELAGNRAALRRMIESADKRTMREAWKRGFLQMAMPPGADAILRIGGGVDARDLLSLPESRVRDLSARSARGYDQGVVPNDPVNGTVRDLMETLGGGGGALIAMYVQTWMSVYEQHGAFAATTATARRWGQTFSDRLSGLGTAPLWDTPRRTTGYDVNAMDVSDHDKKLRSLVPVMENMRAPGTVGAGVNTRISGTGMGRPDMPDSVKALTQQMMQLHQEIQPQLGVINALRSDIQNIRGNPNRLMSPVQMRVAENEINDKMRAISANIMQRIYDREQEFSRQNGGREIRIMSFDPWDKRGIDQFGAARF